MFPHLQACLFRNTGAISVPATYCVDFQYIRWTQKSLNLMSSDVIRHDQNPTAEVHVVGSLISSGHKKILLPYSKMQSPS
jgi:hypothetical protein